MWILLLILTCVVSSRSCAEDSLGVALRNIYQEHQMLAQKPDIARLVALDTDLRGLFNRSWEELRRATAAGDFHEEYDSIGIYIGHYSDVMGYSGKLLAEAHALNPNSQFREYTLFSPASGETVDNAWPNLDSCQVYIQQFPNGHYLYNVYLILAHFNDDIYKEIRSIMKGEEQDYKYDCYKQFIGTEPLGEQLKTVQRKGLKYYDLAIHLKPNDQGLKSHRSALDNGTTTGWYYCPD